MKAPYVGSCEICGSPAWQEQRRDGVVTAPHTWSDGTPCTGGFATRHGWTCAECGDITLEYKRSRAPRCPCGATVWIDRVRVYTPNDGK